MSSSKPAATIQSLDHLVLTVKSIPDTTKWYTTNLGMRSESFISDASPEVTRHSLIFGSQKINLHESGKEFEPKALHVQPGSGDRTSTHPISIFHPSLFPPRITPTTTTTTTITTTHLPTNIPPPNEKVCFITHDPIAQVRHRLISAGIEIVDLSPEKTEEDGTVFRTGARGRLRSVYCRDPDGNLVEISNYV